MMTCRWVLAAGSLYWSRFAAADGVLGGFCANLAQEQNEYEVNYLSGISILMVPYTWCLANCSGWSAFPAKSVALILFQFILPTIIFALVVPRKWHLDLSPTSFDLGGSFGMLILKLLVSLVAVGFVASVDMIIWISMILALVGPMILGGIEEMYLDLISIRALQSTGTHSFTQEERLSVLIALLCGNFDDVNGAATNLNTTLSSYAATTPGAPTLDTRKAQLGSMMNGQTNFGSAVGIPTIFFLAGFLYNALSITDDTVHGINWTPYAVWLMSMVFVAVGSATLLTGNNPSVATVLMGTHYRLSDRPWYHLLADYYEDGLSPVSMYDRGIRKMWWLRRSAAARHQQSYRDLIDLDYWAWTWIGLPTMLLTLFPSIMAYSMANRLPFPRQGCRTFTYLLYACCQILLVLVSVQRNMIGQSLFSSPSKIVGWQVLYGTIVTLAILATFVISLLGSIFQIFGVYNNCFCQTSVSKWRLPASQRWTELGGFDMTDNYAASNRSFAAGMTWAAAVLTGVVCYLGFWYQKMLRRKVAVELARP